MRRGRHEIGKRHGARVFACRDKSRDVRHIHHKVCADFVRNFSETLEVDDTGIRRRARNDKFRFVFNGKSFNLVVIDKSFFTGNAVSYDVEPFARKVDFASVRQMSAAVKAHA